MQREPPTDSKPDSPAPSSLRFPLIVLLCFIVTVLVAALALPRGLRHRPAPSAPPAASQKR